MKKKLAIAGLAALISGFSYGGLGITDNSHAETSDPLNTAINDPNSPVATNSTSAPVIAPKVEKLTVSRESLMYQLESTFPEQLCSKINLAKVPSTEKNCVSNADQALDSCIDEEEDNLPDVISINKSNEVQEVIEILKPILTCTKTKMGIPAEDKVAIRLNFEFNESPTGGK